eukprot:scaffold327053_cov62-Tisochrysis_lutea.AAC.1
MGLRYGGGFQRLVKARMSWLTGVAVGRVRRRLLRQQLVVHPADLDAGLQLTVLLMRGTSREMRLPFSVSAAVLQRTCGHMWAVVHQQTVGTTGVALMCSSGQSSRGTRIDGFEARGLQAGAQHPSREHPCHLYFTAWQLRGGSGGPHRDGTALALALLPAASTELASMNGAPARSAACVSCAPFAVGLGGGLYTSAALCVILAAFDLIKSHSTKPSLPVWYMTRASLGAEADNTHHHPAHAGLLGLGRQARSEAPTLLATFLGVLRRSSTHAAVCSAVTSLGGQYDGQPEPEVTIDGEL